MFIRHSIMQNIEYYTQLIMVLVKTLYTENNCRCNYNIMEKIINRLIVHINRQTRKWINVAYFVVKLCFLMQ